MQLRFILLSVRHSTWGENRLRDENGKGTVGCGSGVRGMEMEMQKNAFSAGYTRYMFIISRTFARGRYSLIVSDYLGRP